jgi:hypothetical protein
MITPRLSSALLAALDGTLLSLHTAAPTPAAPAELAGRSYARPAAALAPVAEGERANATLIRVVNLPTARVTHVALWTGAALRWAVPLAQPVTLAEGDALEFPPGTLAFGVKESA